MKRVAALPDDQIDTSDIPEIKGQAGWVRVHEHPEHPLHRVLSRLVSIRLPEPDIVLAQRLAQSKGLPYQTYIKSLLHEALEHERLVAEGINVHEATAPTKVEFNDRPANPEIHQRGGRGHVVGYSLGFVLRCQVLLYGRRRLVAIATPLRHSIVRVSEAAPNEMRVHARRP